MKHHYHSPIRRGVYSFLLVAGVMTVGTVGMHVCEGLTYLDAFYFMSMIATAQGPTYTPHTVLGKLFSSFMAFVSAGAVVAALGFFYGPFMGKLFHIGMERMKEEIKTLEDKR